MAALHLPSPFFIQIPSSSSSSKPFSPPSLPPLRPAPARPNLRLRRRPGPIFSVGQYEAELRVSTDEEEPQQLEGEEENEEVPASPEDLEYVEQIKRVLDLLRKNRDMTFGEVKLTIMIEDPRDIEQKRLLGIEDPDEVTRDDLAAALEDVYQLLQTVELFEDLDESTTVEGLDLSSVHVEHGNNLSALYLVHEGIIPADRIALRLLAE